MAKIKEKLTSALDTILTIAACISMVSGVFIWGFIVGNRAGYQDGFKRGSDKGFIMGVIEVSKHEKN